MSLRDDLITLSFRSTELGYWVNPSDYEDYKVVHLDLVDENLKNKYIFIGNLESLCFYPDNYLCFCDLFIGNFLNYPYKNYQNSQYNIDKLWLLFKFRKLDKEFFDFLNSQFETALHIKRVHNVDKFLEKLTENLKKK